MFTKKPFWISFGLISLILLISGLYLFPKAFPLLNLDMKMTRQQAKEQAIILAKNNQLGPKQFETAVYFESKSQAQTFVEWTKNGKKNVINLIKNGEYSFYFWAVRLFKAQEKKEVIVWFTPEGKLAGFNEKLPEDEPGKDLSKKEALKIAEKTVQKLWPLAFANFKQMDYSTELKSTGRRDHSFTYEKKMSELGEGSLRIITRISGEKPTLVKKFIYIPRSFSLAFQKKRGANYLISFIFGVVALILYGVGGIGLGIFLLFRKGWIIWKIPFIVAFFVALVQALDQLNQFSLGWMFFDTAQTKIQFVMPFIFSLFENVISSTLFWGISFVAAESLSRKAFPNHPQFWKILTQPSASSLKLLGNTLGAYGLTIVNFFLVVFLYGIMTKYFNWWLPSNPLVNPNILATPFPWISALAIPLKAGLWEECAFRAIPLASAALIGQYFGKRNQFIWGALIIQAIIFGGLHANYPAQPSFARLVELIIPSLLFGWVFIRFGLILGVITHFTFNWVWFSLPLFLSVSSGLNFTHFLTILVGISPLIFVASQRIRAKKWGPFPPHLLNKTFKPIISKKVKEEIIKPKTNYQSKFILPLLGLAIILGLLLPKFGRFKDDAPTIEITRTQAILKAQSFLSSKGIVLNKDWKVGAYIKSNRDHSYKFLWESGGEQLFKQFFPLFVKTPNFAVRFAKKKGSLEEKVEQYTVVFNPSGEPINIKHTVPDAKKMPSLNQAEAKRMAINEIKKRSPLNSSQLTLVSSQSIKKPNRRDWEIIFKDPSQNLPKEGEARIAVALNGNEIGSMTHFIYVQDSWQRIKRQKNSLKFLLQGVFQFVGILAILFGVAWAIYLWVRRQFSLPIFTAVFLLLFILQLVGYLNGFTRTLALFSTQQSVLYQTFLSVGSQSMRWLFFGGALATLLGALVPKIIKMSRDSSHLFWEALAMAIISFSLKFLMPNIDKKSAPLIGSFYSDHFFPMLSPLFKWQIELLTSLGLGLLIIYAGSWLLEKTRRGKWWVVFMFLGIGWVSQSLVNFENIGFWAASSFIFGGLLLTMFLFFLRFHPRLWLFWVGGLMSASSFQYALFKPDNLAWIPSIINIFILWISIYFLNKFIKKGSQI